MRPDWLLLVVQAGLFLLLAFGPRSAAPLPLPLLAATVGGGLLLLAGGGLALAGALRLGRNLTPLPTPKQDGKLIVTGAYRLVRHPIYSGIALAAIGWGLWLRDPLTLGYALLLLIFFDGKSRYEERLLLARFPEYAAYRRRVRKLIPFIY